MKKVFFLLMLIPVIAVAQFTDDFIDGDFLQNPAWSGNVDKFIINDDLILQLNAEEEGSSFLSLPTYLLDSAEWRFRAKLSFSPSANNNARIYLGATNPTPDAPGEAFFLQLGESGSNDAVELHRVSQSTDSVICRSSDGLISSSFDMSFKITRTNSGRWKIFIDPTNSGLYQLEAQGVDNTLIAINHFIIQCNYTISNSTKFYFDDFYHGNIIADLIAPQIESVEVVTQNSLDINFSEYLEESSVVEVLNYFVNNGVGSPFQAVLDSQNPDIIHLFFENDFENNREYSINVSGIKDLSGNIMHDEVLLFVYLQPIFPHIGDVVINEIMCDVNPVPTNLPAYDFVELFNCSNNLLNLTGCVLSFGTHRYVFPENSTVFPNDFLLISDDNSGYEEYGNVIYFTQFPVNSESQMILKSSSGELLHYLDYKKEWYHDEEKENGGWSLEMIDANNAFGGVDNWNASQHESGGTPANANSVLALNTDNENPFVKHVSIIDENSVELIFSESLDSVTVFQNKCFEVQEFGFPDSVTINFPAHNCIVLYDSDFFFSDDVVYHLKINSLAEDYAGNFMKAETVRFANHSFNYGEIVINEIMADVNPAPNNLPEAEYIELYNKTDFSADLSQFTLCVGSKNILFPLGTSLMPGGYLVITESENEIENTRNRVFVSSLGISNSGCEIQLIGKDNQLIHFVDFEIDWYDDELKEEGGWSLEMIDVENPCGENCNWTASKNSAGGTPGIENSVKELNPDNDKPDFYRLMIPDSASLICVFNESMDSTTFYDFVVQPGNIIPERIKPIAPAYKSVKLEFSSSFEKRKEYSLKISNSLTDCVGNTIESSEVPFLIPETADSNDIVINEILFNALDGGSEFIEIYNRSTKAIDLSELIIDYLDDFTMQSESKDRITFQNYILMPKKYLAVSRNFSGIEDFYHVNDIKTLFECDNMPNLSASSGVVDITDLNGNVIDRALYSDEMHYPLLNSTKGVSLERIYSETSSKEKKNWHSAAEKVGFATPGYENSQRVNNESAGDDFVLEKKIFSPDNDGIDDVLVIDYNMSQLGYTANIRVFDKNGYSVRVLENNLFLAASGKIFWDGITDDREKAAIGYYILYFEIYNTNGDVEHFKKTVVVSGKL
ncbi:MAG: lamin tail domain-containing protein [Bacteroidota bacterium]|nr:lamin tail domain-containing protein [Bacteroidota bacterium]